MRTRVPALFLLPAISLTVAACGLDRAPEVLPGQVMQHLICSDDDVSEQGWPQQCEKTIPDQDGKTWPDKCPPYIRSGTSQSPCKWSVECSTGFRCDCAQPPADGSARGTCRQIVANDPDWTHFGG